MSAVTKMKHAATGPPIEKSPAMLSWRWWVLLFGAFKLWEYTPKDWAVWNLSSYISYATVFGVFKPMAVFISVKMPWLAPAIKTAWVKFIAVVVATSKFVVEAFVNAH